MTRSRVLAGALLCSTLAACSGEPKAPPAAPARRVVATFEGAIDAGTGAVRIGDDPFLPAPSSPAATKPGPAPAGLEALAGLPVVKDGLTGAGPPNTVELVTEGATTVAGGCGAVDAFEGQVRLRSFFTAPLSNAYVELTSLAPSGFEACNSAPAPSGVSAALGLFAYGDLTAAGTAGGSALAPWRFRVPSGGSFTFTGRVVAEGLPPRCAGTVAFPGFPAAPATSLVGDLDGDGTLDLVGLDSTVGYRALASRGLGNGTFGAAVATGVSPSITAVALADVTLDGLADLVYATQYLDVYGRQYVRVQANDGKLGFGTTTSYTLGTGSPNPVALAASDLNADGRPDVVTANDSANTFSVFLNTGGALAAKVDYPSGGALINGAHPKSVTIADLDGDGRPDLTGEITGTGQIAILLNAGSGTLSVKTPVSGPSSSFALLVGDVTGDGKPDLVALSRSSASFTVYRNQSTVGVPSFLPLAPQSAPGILGAPSLVDVDRDGKLDLSGGLGDRIAVLKGSGTGTFGTPTYLEAGSYPGGASAWDFDRDGIADLGTSSSSGFVILRGKGAGAYTTYRSTASGAGPVAAAAADLDGDGLPEVVTASATAPYTLSVLPNAAGALSAAESLALAGVPAGVAIGDLDGEGLPDVAVANQTSGMVDLFLNRGGLVLETGPSVSGGGVTGGVAVADLDRDGRAEVVVADAAAGVVWVHARSASGAWDLHTPYAAPGAAAVAVADVTGDGRPDLVVSGGTTNQVHVLRNLGSGFAAAASYALGTDARAVAIGDLDGDGRLDVAVASQGAKAIAVLRNAGAGVLAAASTWPAGPKPASVAIGDVDADGSLDLLVGDDAGYQVFVLQNDGAGAFPTRRAYATQPYPAASLLADLDADGALDVVAASRARGAVDVLRGGCLP